MNSGAPPVDAEKLLKAGHDPFQISEIKIDLKEFIPYMCSNEDLDNKAFARVAKREISQNISCKLVMESILKLEGHEIESE